MATDLATLAIKVENGDVVKATTSLSSMEVAGTKAEASTNRLTRRMALLEIQAREMDAALAKSQTTTGKLVSAMGLTEESVARLGKALSLLSVATAAGFIGHKLIEETIESQNQMAQLEAAVTATGGAAGRTVSQLDALSLALQKSTTFSDEQVKSAESILLTFNKIKGDNLDRATAAVTNLAQRLGKDLPEAALQVGKALQDPVEGLQSLQRLGIRFSSSQKQTIQDLVDTGRAAEAQGIILRELEQRYAGAAEAAKNTLGGALKGLANDFGDLFEVSRGGTSGVVDAIHGLDAAVRTVGENMGTVVRVGELVAAVFAGKMVAGLTKAAAAQIELASAAAGASTVQREAAASAVATATAQEAAAAKAVVGYQAEIAEIERLIVVEQERAAAARAAAASVSFQLTPTNTGATGPAADYYGRKAQEEQNRAATAARTAALEEEAAAIAAEEALEQRRAGVIGQATAAEVTATEATTARTLAVAREGEVIAATSLAAQAGAAASGLFGKAITALGGPISATIIAATLINAALDAYEDHMLKAAEQTDAQREATERALATAHARAAAQRKEADDLSESAKKLAALLQQRDAEIHKLGALNAAYHESALSVALLGIEQDAQIKKSENVEGHTKREIAILDGRTDALTRQKIAQVLLNDSLERENHLRETRNANADAIRGAQENVVLAGEDPATAERTRNQFEAINKRQDAERKYNQEQAQNEIDLAGARQRGDTAALQAIAQRRAAQKQEYDEAVANAKRVADLNDDAITKAREAATKLSVDTTVSDTEAQIAGIRAMMAAELEGGKAVEQLSIQLAGQDAVRRAVNDATARGTQLTDEQAEALRRSAEELERTRIAAAKLQAVYREVSSAANQFFADVFDRKNPLPGLAQRLKEELEAALSDAVARPLTIKIAKILGIELPESKQEKAAKEMNIAADKQLRAAEVMSGAASDGSLSPNGGIADASTVFSPQSSAMQRYLQQFLKFGGVAVGGYGAGYGIGASTQSQAAGAVGGAVSGAALGAAVAGPVGAVVGGFAGLVGGLTGASDAAHDAAEQLLHMRDAAHQAVDAFHVSVVGDSLDREKYQLEQDYRARLKQLVDANGGKYPDSFPRSAVPRGNIADDFTQAAADYTEAVRRATENYQNSVTDKYAEFHANYLDAIGQHAQAEAYRREEQFTEQRRELVASFGESIDKEEQRTLDEFDRWRAAAADGANALNAFTSSVSNAPTGFKLEGYIQQYAKGSPLPGQWQVPTNPFIPPTSPLSPPTLPALSRTGASSVTAPASLSFRDIIVNVPKTNAQASEIAKAVVKELDSYAASMGGSINSTRVDALKRYPST